MVVHRQAKARKTEFCRDERVESHSHGCQADGTGRDSCPLTTINCTLYHHDYFDIAHRIVSILRDV